MSKSNPSDMPAVLHIVWNLIRGGTEGQCARVAMQLARRGQTHRVAVFRSEGFFLNDVEQACGPVHVVDIERIKSLRTLREIKGLRDFIRREHIDVVHAWDADAAVFGAWGARWAGVPLITSRRDLGEIYAPWKLSLMRRADRRARAVVVNADAIRQGIIREGCADEKIRVIPNILDVDEFDRLAREPFDPLPKGRWIAMVARLDPEKDVDLVIRVAAALKMSHPDIHFAIAGDGRERTRLEGLARELKVQDRVRFLGETTSVPAFLKQCVMGLLTPNANEGLSNTILEYMAAGLPVVATDCGGNRELVRDEITGRLTPIGDVQQAATAVAELLDRPAHARTCGERGRAIIEKSHRPEHVADHFSRVYASINSSS